MTVYDWRGPRLESREQSNVLKELAGAKVLDLDGGQVLLELTTGEKVWYGAVGPDGDVEITPYRPRE